MEKKDIININMNSNFFNCCICGETACGYQDFEENESKGRLYYCAKHIRGNRML